MEQSHYVELNPKNIEARSFEIITSELGHLHLDETIAPIIKRVVHTTADFDYARITEVHPQAIAAATSALSKGCRIYTDTRMIIAGVSKPALKKWNSSVYTFVDDDDVIAKSKEQGITRSILGIDKTMESELPAIYVIGNAPTALVRIYELIEAKKISPALVIGVPVGFVGASESKELMRKTDIPYIITQGRKGGSTVAVAILNALLYMVK